jgi:hypothetical protein
MDAPLFEVTAAAADVAARRLTTAAKVQAVALGGVATDTVLIETIIDRVSAMAVAYCGLARDTMGAIPTFGLETCRATWFSARHHYRHHHHHHGDPAALILPWRTPITEIVSVVENDVALTTGTDYRLFGAGVLRRMCSDLPITWCPGKIVVVYKAGWTVATVDAIPPDLEAAIIEQVKTMYLTRGRDPTLRSETVPDVHQATFSVAGGDSVGDSGLLVQVEGALATYKGWAAG